MKEFYKNNKKKIITGLSLLLILAGGYWSVKYHLSKTVEIILQIAFPAGFIHYTILRYVPIRIEATSHNDRNSVSLRLIMVEHRM